ncbi:hypothetical protein [Methanobrevibacter sp.]|uniref:hypothetical protein n=1 Tax=Methanobrevibacter sp. TaxID=66852 RepID=UPI0038641C42
MDKKYILMLIVIIAAIAAVAGYFLLADNQLDTISEHKTIVLSKSAYMEVPENPNATDKVDKKGIFYYKDKDDDINITSCSNLSTSSSAKELKKLKNSVATGSKKLKEGNVVIYEKDGIYSVFVKNTQYNDTLLIQSSNKDLLLQCWNTVKYHDPTQKIKFDNDTSSSSSGSVINAAEKTETVVKASAPSTSSSSSSSSSDSSWGYEWRSSSSSGYSGSSGSRSSGSVGGSASSSDLFDYG